jgi:hypothetical protein
MTKRGRAQCLARILLCALCACAALAGCGGGGDGPAPADLAQAPVAAQGANFGPILASPRPAQAAADDRIDRLQGQLDLLRRQVDDLQRQLSMRTASSHLARPPIDDSAQDCEQEEALRVSGNVP